MGKTSLAAAFTVEVNTVSVYIMLKLGLS